MSNTDNNNADVPAGCLPFDLDKALAGAKVRTRDGEGVTSLTRFGAPGKNIVGVVSGNAGDRLMSWYPNGTTWLDNLQGSYDLFLVAPPRTKREAWVNVGPTYENGLVFVSNGYQSREQADTNHKHRKACCRIEWEE